MGGTIVARSRITGDKCNSGIAEGGPDVPNHNRNRRRRAGHETGRLPDGPVGPRARHLLARCRDGNSRPPRSGRSYRCLPGRCRGPRAHGGDAPRRRAVCREGLRDAGSRPGNFGGPLIGVDGVHIQDGSIRVGGRSARHLVHPGQGLQAAGDRNPNHLPPRGEPGVGRITGGRQWFDLFRDDTLTQLVRNGAEQNFEIRIAAQRVLQARAAYGITRSEQFPSIDVSAGVTAARSSQTGASRGSRKASTPTSVTRKRASASGGKSMSGAACGD